VGQLSTKETPIKYALWYFIVGERANQRDTIMGLATNWSRWNIYKC